MIYIFPNIIYNKVKKYGDDFMIEPGELPVIDCKDGEIVILDGGNSIKEQPQKSKKSSRKLSESSSCPGELPVAN